MFAPPTTIACADTVPLAESGVPATVTWSPTLRSASLMSVSDVFTTRVPVPTSTSCVVTVGLAPP